MEKISVGKLLRDRRNELSLTQRQVANQVGVTEATVSRWESGDIDNMRRDKIAGLASDRRFFCFYVLFCLAGLYGLRKVYALEEV